MESSSPFWLKCARIRWSFFITIGIAIVCLQQASGEVPDSTNNPIRGRDESDLALTTADQIATEEPDFAEDQEPDLSTYKTVLGFRIRRGKPEPDVTIYFGWTPLKRWLNAMCKYHPAVRVPLDYSQDSDQILFARRDVDYDQTSSVQYAFANFYECYYDSSEQYVTCKRARAGTCDPNSPCIALSTIHADATKCGHSSASVVWVYPQTVSEFYSNSTTVRSEDCEVACYTAKPTPPTSPVTTSDDPGHGGSSDKRDDNDNNGSDGNTVVIAVSVSVAVIVVAVVIGVVACIYLRRTKSMNKELHHIPSMSNDIAIYQQTSKKEAPPFTMNRSSHLSNNGESQNREESDEQYDYIDDYAHLDETTKYSHEYGGLGYNTASGARSTTTGNEYQELADETPYPSSSRSYFELEAEVEPTPTQSPGNKYHELEPQAPTLPSRPRPPTASSASSLQQPALATTEIKNGPKDTISPTVGAPELDLNGGYSLAKPPETDIQNPANQSDFPDNENMDATRISDRNKPAPLSVENTLDSGPVFRREYLEILEPQSENEIKGSSDLDTRSSVLTFPDRKKIISKELERTLGPQPPLPRPGADTAYYSKPELPKPL